MRRLLGRKGEPRLLVETEAHENNKEFFKFHVINGAWSGVFRQGTVEILNTDTQFKEIKDIQILCEDQELLKGNYNEVFERYEELKRKK